EIPSGVRTPAETHGQDRVGPNPPFLRKSTDRERAATVIQADQSGPVGTPIVTIAAAEDPWTRRSWTMCRGVRLVARSFRSPIQFRVEGGFDQSWSKGRPVCD